MSHKIIRTLSGIENPQQSNPLRPLTYSQRYFRKPGIIFFASSCLAASISTIYLLKYKMPKK